MNRPIVLVLVLAGLAGCNSSPSAPSAILPRPAPVAQPAPASPQLPTGVTLRGSVTDTAFRPLGDVLVEIIEGPDAGQSTRSDGTGQYSFFGKFDDTTRVRASKTGHVTSIGALSPSCATCNPNSRWIYFYLAVHASPVSIAGDYTLTFVADSTCAFSEAMRTRTYEATITESINPHNPPNTIFTARLSGAEFLAGHETIFIGVAGDFVTLGFGGHGPGLVEQVAPNTYLAFDGWVQTSVGTAAVSTIAVPFDGTIEYCERKLPIGSWYECAPSQAIAQATCASKQHQLILSRR